MKEIRRDLIFKYRPLSNIQISKDDQKVYFVSTSADLKNNDYTQDLWSIDTASNEVTGLVKGMKRVDYFLLNKGILVRDTDKKKEGYTFFKWLNEKGCAALVNPTLLQQYAMSVSRWIQCEETISEFGFLAKHPTTGAAIASPYVAMSQQYMKQVNQIWYQIYQIVKENCSVDYQGAIPQDDVMERLLRARRGG